MSEYDFNNCNPDEVVPVIHLHGTADLIVGYTSGVDFGPWGNEGVLNIIDLWTGMMGTTEQDETDLPNLELFDLSSVEFFRFYGAPGGQEFHHYRVSGGGHDWFGAWGNQDIESTAKRSGKSRLTTLRRKVVSIISRSRPPFFCNCCSSLQGRSCC